MVESIDDAAIAVKQAVGLDRKAVRERFEERFTASRMATDYVAEYEGLLRGPTMGLRRDDAIRSRIPNVVAPALTATTLPARTALRPTSSVQI
jgi:hypothetical protein